MSANRYLPAAQAVARVIPGILRKHGLVSLINRNVLTESERGNAWLFIVLDDSVSENLESYASPNLLSDLSAALHGHPVLFSNSLGLRYSILLSPLKSGVSNT